MPSELLIKTLTDLEWKRLEAEVQARRRGPLPEGPGLPLAGTRAATERAQAETGEAYDLLLEGAPLPLDGIQDIAAHLLRLGRHGDLDAAAINQVRATLGAARVLRRFLSARRERAAALFEACPIDPSLDRVTDALDDAFDIDGTLADHASADLKRLRQETRNLRAHLVRRLEELVHQQAELLSDRFYTLRDGRYVLPVRSDTHERVHGIVHGASASGATIFVEPRALVAQGNRLKLAEAEQEREEMRILGALSELLRQVLPSAQAAFDALRHADLRAACARLSRDYAFTRPVLCAEPRIQLREARHPTLLMDGVDVVANDVDAQAGRALVISGPNAGGKTVALKLLGLSALMVRAGLFLPAAVDSRCGFFDAVLTDIGDEQNLSKNLSTFSAHVDHVRKIVEVAGSGTLVLLDELAGSTDPQEGAALACATVEQLCAQGAAVAVTTHYEPVKARALSDPRMRNASVGFDVTRMQPTFRLHLDVPGASSALVVAERFGLPAGIIARARALVPEQNKQFEALVTRLQDQLREGDRQRTALAAEQAELGQLKAALEAELNRQKARGKKVLTEESARTLEALRELRLALEEARKETRRQLSRGELQALSQQVRASGEAVQLLVAEADLSPEPSVVAGGSLSGEDLTVGRRVYVPRLRAEAEVIEEPSKGRIRVAAGALRLWVDVHELTLPPSSERMPEEKLAPVLAPGPATHPRLAQRTSDNSLNLRGMRVDDALALVDTFLDRMYGQDQRVAYIEHGSGSGGLREAVREHLRRPSPYVESVRAGLQEEGGERMTVVMLR